MSVLERHFRKSSKDLRISIETNAVERLLVAILKNDGVYGIKAIEKALEYGAISELLIVDQYLKMNLKH